MTRYGKPNEEKTEVVKWYTVGQPFTGPWGYDHNPTQDQIESIGFLVVVEPTTLQFERKVVPEVPIVNSDHITFVVAPWTQEEIDVEALREANEALFIMTEANAELAYWIDKTPQDVTDIITAAPNTFASFKQMIEKNAQSIRVMALFLKLLRDTGRIG